MYNLLKKYTKRIFFLGGTYTKDFFQPCKETLQRKIRQRQVSFHFIVDSKSKNKMVLKGI
jgi:hypothetical protein